MSGATGSNGVVAGWVSEATVSSVSAAEQMALGSDTELQGAQGASHLLWRLVGVPHAGVAGATRHEKLTGWRTMADTGGRRMRSRIAWCSVPA